MAEKKTIKLELSNYELTMIKDAKEQWEKNRKSVDTGTLEMIGDIILTRIK